MSHHKQHFLLSAEARTLSVRKVFEMSDDEAFAVFREVRWGKSGEVVCPVCGVIGKHYFKATRKQWQCKDCKHTFSVTSGTIFAFHKLPLKGLPQGHRYLHQCGEGHFSPATGP